MAECGYVVLRRPPSTHQLGCRIAREYSQEHATPPRTTLLAWRQSAGHGRNDRSWSSPPGGIYVTLIRSLTAGSGGAPLQTLPLLVATTLCESLNIDLAGRCRLKWPNDLLVDGRKLAGILIDVASQGAPSEPASGASDALCVISFGVNHGRLDREDATSLEREAPGETLLVDLAVRLIEAVDSALDRESSEAEVVDRYQRLSLHRPGDVLRCRLHGDEVEGVFQGFDPHGFLLLSVDGEQRRVTAGEVFDRV